MTIEEARQWAAQAWCKPTTETKVMDVDLAEEFAQTLCQRVNEELCSKEIREARATMARHFSEDPFFRKVYQDNIAMLLHDRHFLQHNPDAYNKAADDIIRLVFES